jgi:predicted CopG family antitoxin
MYGARMASTNVNLNQAAHDRLKKLRQPGQSFSDVVLQNLVTWADTCRDVLEIIKDRKRRRSFFQDDGDREQGTRSNPSAADQGA